MADPLLRSIFVEALDRPPGAERARFLDEACGSDAALRQKVEMLLQAHDEAGEFFSDPSKRTIPIANLASSEKAGDWIGRYKLLQQIGEGGCGVVYMAEQEEPVRRRVALKVIKLGMDTKQVIARFEAERQALAMMDHPNIARVLDGGVGGEVVFLSVSGSNVYVGGDFQTAGTRAMPAANIATWDGSVWSVSGASGLNASVNAIATSSSEVYVGGNFYSGEGNNALRYVARWNGTNWSTLGSGLDGPVWALTALSNRVYAAGSFTNAGSVTVNRIAHWNGSGWSALGSGVTGNVYALAMLGDDLYAGGDFESIGGIAATNLAKWDGNNWLPVGTGLDQGYVYDLEVSGNDLYVAGGFQKAGGITVNCVAKWNGNAWSALGSGPANNGWPIEALAVSGTIVYACSYNGEVYRWNGSTWSALPITAFTPASSTCMVVVGNDLYIGGYLEGLNTYVAKWNGATLSALGSGVNNIVRALAASGNALYVGGEFTVAGGKNSGYVAKAIISAAGGRFENMVFSPVAGFSCTFTDGTVGYPYRIQASPSGAPGTWVDFKSVNYAGPVAVTDASAVNGTNRFFRAVSP